MSLMTHKVDMAVTIPMIRDAQANPKEQPGRGLSSPRPTKPTSCFDCGSVEYILSFEERDVPEVISYGVTSYQKELRLKFQCEQEETNTWLPGATRPGTDATGTGDADAYGMDLVYDYTSIVFDDPDAAGTDVSQTLVLMGGKPSGPVGNETCAPVIYNWKQWRHSFTPSAAADDIADNVFSYAMQQSSTADKIIDIVEDEADEKPYNLDDFFDKTISTLVSTSVGSPTSQTICVPLGLMKITTGVGGATWETEVVGVVEL